MIDQASAEAELKKIMDKNDSEFVSPTTNEQSIDVATKGWANALYECAKNISPTSAAADQAKKDFTSAASGMEKFETGAATFKAAVTKFATTLGNGMGGYTCIPSPTEYNPAIPETDPADPAESDGALAAESMATRLADWFKTWQAVNNATGEQSKWS